MTPATAFSALLQIHLVVPFGSPTTLLFFSTTSLIFPLSSPSSSEETVSLGATNPPFIFPPKSGLISNPICTAKFLGVNTTASSANNVLPVENTNPSSPCASALRKSYGIKGVCFTMQVRSWPARMDSLRKSMPQVLQRMLEEGSSEEGRRVVLVLGE